MKKREMKQKRLKMHSKIKRLGITFYLKIVHKKQHAVLAGGRKTVNGAYLNRYAPFLCPYIRLQAALALGYSYLPERGRKALAL